MRDLFIFLVIVGGIPFVLIRPQVGILAWLWISIMNPHKLSYGWISQFPILDIVAAVTLISCVLNIGKTSPAKRQFLIYMLIVFYVWVTLTAVFSVSWYLAQPKWMDFTKTILLLVLIFGFMNKKHWIIAMIWVFVLSVGFTSFKGGVFTVITGGSGRVWGSLETAWGDNNGVSLATLIVLPLLMSMYFSAQKRWQKMGILGGSATFVMAILGTHSRGGLVGFLGMSLFYITHAKHKFLGLAFLIIAGVAGFFVMPQSWHDRMESTLRPKEDNSASTRLIQWQYAMDIATERPFFGNGFNAFFYQPYYYKYVAHLDENRAVHSNYFEVLGEHGYIGLAMYLIIGVGAVLIAGSAAKKVERTQNGQTWTIPILRSARYSFIGYALNGLTVNMAFLDLYYYLLAIIILLISQAKTPTAVS